jgi:hypothetical protein
MPSPSRSPYRPLSPRQRRISTSALTPDFRRILISKKQTSRLLGCCVRTTEHLMLSGKLQSVKIGDRRFVSLAALFAFAEGEHPGPTELRAERLRANGAQHAGKSRVKNSRLK